MNKIKIQNDKERFIQLQLSVLKCTKKVIARHAPGILLASLQEYMQKVGGDVLIIDKNTIGIPVENPFRIRVTVQEEITFDLVGNAIRGEYVSKVMGWG